MLSSRASTISRTSRNSISNPTPSSFARVESSPPPEVIQARVVFEYTATSPYELSIGEGETVKVLEDDDGSGWIKVANKSGRKGLVPASYVKVVGSERKPNVIPRTSAQYGVLISLRCPSSANQSSLCACLTTTHDCNLRCLLAVRGVYNYQATGEDEISVKEGCMIQLTAGPRGGRNYADGWWEGQCFRCVFDTLLRASSRRRRVAVRLISLHPAAAFGSSVRLGSRKEKITGHDRQGRVLPDFVPLPLRLPSSSVCLFHGQIFSILHQI